MIRAYPVPSGLRFRTRNCRGFYLDRPAVCECSARSRRQLDFAECCSRDCNPLYGRFCRTPEGGPGRWGLDGSTTVALPGETTAEAAEHTFRGLRSAPSVPAWIFNGLSFSGRKLAET